MTAHPLVSCCWAIVAYLAGVVLRVLDVGLYALSFERLLQLGTVAVLPTARRRCVGQDDASTLAGCRSACSSARLPCRSCGVAVTSGERCYGKARR